jgi:hypothetical protein
MKLLTFHAHLARAWVLFRNRGVSSEILRGFIEEVEKTSGYARNDVRAKVKTWLIAHRSSLAAEDVLLAEAHFGYLLPPGWRSQGVFAE